MISLAYWQSVSSFEVEGKIVSMIWPVCAFVALGYEEMVVNLFLVLTGFIERSEPVEYNAIEYIYLNFIPVQIGNLIAGIISIGAIYKLI
jgi:formate/nitrite transporter FocA (FNT family)